MTDSVVLDEHSLRKQKFRLEVPQAVGLPQHIKGEFWGCSRVARLGQVGDGLQLQEADLHAVVHQQL